MQDDPATIKPTTPEACPAAAMAGAVVLACSLLAGRLHGHARLVSPWPIASAHTHFCDFANAYPPVSPPDIRPSTVDRATNELALRAHQAERRVVQERVVVMRTLRVGGLYGP